MASDKFFSKSIRMKNPFVPYGIARIVFALLLAAVIAMAYPQMDIEAALSAQQALPILRLIAMVLGMVIGAVWAIQSLFSGFKHIGALIVPPRTPMDLDDPKEIANSLLRYEMPVYKVPTSGPLALAYRYLGDRIPYMTERPRQVVELAVDFTRSYIWFVILAIIAAVGIVYVPEEVLAETNLPDNFLHFPVTFTLWLTLALGMNLLGMFMLMPKSTPIAEVKENILEFRGAGDPSAIPPAIEKAMMEMRMQDIPNRVIREGFTKITGGEGKTGDFSGQLYIENQPAFSEYRNSPYAYLALVGAIVFGVWGVGSLLNASLGRDLSTTGQVLNVLWTAITSIVLMRIGSSMFRRAHYILGSFRYESVMAMLSIEGQYGIVRVRAGRSMTDSVESENTTLRSDGELRLYATKLLTESYMLKGRRHIIGMVVDEDADRATELLLRAIQQFERRGVRIRGVDLSDENLVNLIQANVAVETGKKHAAHQIEAGEQPRTLTDGGNEAPTQPEAADDPQVGDDDDPSTDDQ